MKIQEAMIASTHIDKNGDVLTKESLVDMANNLQKQYVPILIEHDPRNPPVGRVISGKVMALNDGHFGLQVVIELWEPDDILSPADSEKTIPLPRYSDNKLHIDIDCTFNSNGDQNVLAEIAEVLDIKPEKVIKRSLDPISVLTIGGLFVLGQFATGFLGKLGSDAAELFRNKIKALFGQRDVGKADRILQFELMSDYCGEPVCVEVLLTNPTTDEIDNFFKEGLQQLDRIVPYCLPKGSDIRSLVFYYSKGALSLKFAVRKDAVPLYPRNNREVN